MKWRKNLLQTFYIKPIIVFTLNGEFRLELMRFQDYFLDSLDYHGTTRVHAKVVLQS